MVDWRRWAAVQPLMGLRAAEMKPVFPQPLGVALVRCTAWRPGLDTGGFASVVAHGDQ